jgi:hypothetical protein
VWKLCGPHTNEPCPLCGSVGKSIQAKASSTVRIASRAVPDIRYSFTAQFLRGAAIFAKQAHEMENAASQRADEEFIYEHRACVVASITQSVAALEAEISEVMDHGPGHHLGSNSIDVNGRDFLHPLSDMIDRERTLDRYELVLHLLKKPSLDKGGRYTSTPTCWSNSVTSLFTTSRSGDSRWRGRNSSDA